MPCLISGVILRRSARYFCLSMLISGSVRHSWPCASQYAFHAPGSFVVGRCIAVACLPSCSLIPVSLFLKNHQILTEEIIFHNEINGERGGSYNQCFA